MKKCFECGDGPTEDHHVVPRSKGGTKTIPLCHSCHGKVHNTKRSLDHVRLTKEGLAAAKSKGVKLGRQKGFRVSQDAKDKSATGRRKAAAKADPMVLNIAHDEKGKGKTLAAIAEKLNDFGATAPKGGKFSAAQVRRMLNRHPKPL